MKKLFLLLILLILTSCSSTTVIYRSLYIASIGFDFYDDEYTGYFLLPSSLDVGANNTSDEGESNIAIVSGDSLIEVFNKLNNSSSLTINYKHISTLILNTSILNEKNIEDLISFIINYVEIDFNFYVFITEDNIKKIYEVKNPNKEGLLATILIDPVNLDYKGYTAKPIHFLNFCRDYYNNKTICIPLLKVEKVWNEDDLLNANSVVFYNHNLYDTLDGKDYMFFNSADKIEFNINNNAIIFVDYKYKLKKKKTEIRIESGCSVTKDEELSMIEEEIKNKIISLVENYKYIDFLNLKYYGYDYDDLIVNVKLYELITK
ncbi:MAG: hypothetical protein ACI35S_01505 [Anaeroplasma sp.]